MKQNKPFIIETEPGTYFWCACGKSSKQPFCDGSHKGTKFSPVKKVIKEKTRLAWCGCKYSEDIPFCDGTHSRL